MDFELKRSLLPKNKLALIYKGVGGNIQYCCVQCSAKYNDKEKMELHLCTHYKEFKFLCGICGTGLKRKEHLERHTLGHQELRPHVCSECGKGFKRKEHLNIHRSIHTGHKNQMCPLCNKSFHRKDHLQKHLQTHTKLFSEHNIFPVNDQELMDIKNEFDDDIKPIFDEDGETMEVDEGNFVDGQSTQVDPERPFVCCVCNKSYKRKDHLKLHSITHMQKDKICNVCGKAFHREQQLLTHMNVHLQPYPSDVEETSVKGIPIMPLDSLLVPRPDKSDSRPHECPICHRKFKRRQHLKVHTNVHLKQNQPVIWCSLCNVGFQSNDEFEGHPCMATPYFNSDFEEAPPVQDAKKENSYPTSESEEATEIENISAQETPMEATDEQNLPTPQRVYVCKFCSKPFKRKDHYKIHLHIHTGIRSFFCPDCGKGFYRKDHLQKHALVHLKAKPKTKKDIPGLLPIHMLPKIEVALKKEVKPEITITAPSNTKLRVPLQIKVPYQVVMSMDNGEQHAVTIDPANSKLEILS